MYYDVGVLPQGGPEHLRLLDAGSFFGMALSLSLSLYIYIYMYCLFVCLGESSIQVQVVVAPEVKALPQRL